MTITCTGTTDYIIATLTCFKIGTLHEIAMRN